MAAVSQIEPDRTARVSTLELFFDLVFVFTITQLTAVLVAGGDAVAIAQVVLMLTVIWWMYDGYAWLTNAIATDHLRHRLLLIGGMGAFLVIALAVPAAFGGQVGVLAAVVAAALVVEGSWGPRVRPHRPNPSARELAVVIEGELGRVGPQAHRVDLVLALPCDPRLDQLLREDFALQEELVVDLERVECLRE